MTAPSTASILGRRTLGQVPAADYVDWAVGQLVAGLDSPTLRILAGLDARVTWFEAEDLFHRSLVELGVPLPDRATAVRGLACEIARDLLEGRVTLADGVRALQRLYGAAEHADYGAWLQLDEALHDLRFRTSQRADGVGTGEELEAEAHRLAREMLDRAQGET